MKTKLSDAQREKTVSNIITIAAACGMFAVVYYFGKITGFISSVLQLLTPFLIGGSMAFLLVPIHRRLQVMMVKLPCFRSRRGQKISNAVTAFLCVLLLIALLVAFSLILLPQMITSIKTIIEYITQFVTSQNSAINGLLLKYEFLELNDENLMIAWDKIAKEIMNYTSLVFENVMMITNSLYNVVYYILVGLIAAFYILVDRERFCSQTKKICYSLFSASKCENIIRWTRRANEIFSGFIRGKILDSLIIGVLCYVCMLIFRIEYPLFISVVVGITNIIPFFGPLIGAVPSILILLIVNPMSALWFAVFILILQQIDGNIIGPKILGDNLGISAFWIMVSIIVGSGLFGFAGMLLSVPVFALVYAICKTLLEERLVSKDLPIPSSSYTSAPESFMDENSQPMPGKGSNSRLLRRKGQGKKS